MMYRNQARIEAEDQELEELEAQYRKEFGDSPPEEVVNKPQMTPEELKEEETWKKRHSDLRSYTQRQINDLQKQLSDTQKALQEKENQSAFPVNKEEAEEWVKNYPDLARVIGTLIDTRSEQRINTVADEVRDVKTQLEAERLANAREKALERMLKVHPDFLDLANDDDFKTWVEDQPKKRGPIVGQALYDAIYKNETDASSAIEAVNQYKTDKGLEKSRARQPADVAQAVKRSTAPQPSTDGDKKTFKESEIEKMKPWEFDRYEEEIEKARREGRIVYDISGAAR